MNKFKLGQLVITPAAQEMLGEVYGSTKALMATEFIQRHLNGDWGGMDEHDIEVNNTALATGGRLFSSYDVDEKNKLWIITEGDRSVTTLLLPQDY